MAYFLIDLENKGCNCEYISHVKNGDEIVIFYSDICKKIYLKEIECIMSLNYKCNSFKVITGSKNALDFQLSSYLGFIVNEVSSKNSKQIYIVSNDKGYDCLCNFWNLPNVSVKRLGFSVKSDVTKNTKFDTVRTMNALKEIFGEEKGNEVAAIIGEFPTLVAINNELIKKYKDNGETYRIIKPLLAGKQ